jgi:hypothetical protein
MRRTDGDILSVARLDCRLLVTVRPSSSFCLGTCTEPLRLSLLLTIARDSRCLNTLNDDPRCLRSRT